MTDEKNLSLEKKRSRKKMDVGYVDEWQIRDKKDIHPSHRVAVVRLSELKEKIENANRGVMKKAFDYAHSEKDFYKGVKDKGYPISVLVEPYREGFEQLQRELLSALGVGEREKKEKKE